jgi:bifunctional DNA-binding transcriptional regulator/antitoxin component of YhaV-PrlF toxin-antitoxin module
MVRGEWIYQMMHYTTTVNTDGEDYIITIPEEILNYLNWKEGDTLNWQISDSKQIIITKIKDTSSIKEEPTMSDYDWYESESEGKDFDEKYDQYIEDTAKETFGQYYHSPEAQGSWYAIKAEAIQKYAT